MVEKQGQANASLQRMEDTRMGFYLETREQTLTAGMAAYMKHNLSPADDWLWLQTGE